MSPKKIFIISLLVTIVVGFFCFSNLVIADEFGLEEAVTAAGLMNNNQRDLPTLVGSILGTALSFIGVLFFALMVFGGFMWMTARGNEEQTKKALNTITAAVIGLIIVLSSYTITSFVFKSVGINQSTSKKDTLGQDPWCGKTGPGIAFKRDFNQPESWGYYECMDVFLESEEEKGKVKEFCKTGSEYAIEKINQCPGAQLCCDFTKVPAGYGWYCLLEKEKDGTKELKCEKIGFDFKTETKCIPKDNNKKYYETELDCNKAIDEANKPKKNKGELCIKTEECNTELVCRYFLISSQNAYTISDYKKCLQKLNKNQGPCVDPTNDCAIETHKCLVTDFYETDPYKVCDELRKEGKCESDSDCAQGYDCKDSSCIENCKSDNDCPGNEKNCVNVGSNSICQAGNNGDFCNDDNHCKENFWCKKAGAQNICSTKLKNKEQCDRGRQCEGGICENGKCN